MKLLLIASLFIVAACASKQTAETPTPTTVNAAASAASPVPSPTPPKVKKEKPKKSEAKSESVAGEVTCKFNEHVRSLKVEKKESGGCEVIYTKDGQPSSVASAANDLSHCDKIQEKIKTNLTTAGYTCE